MEILHNKIVVFENNINVKEWIDLIENVNIDSYPFTIVERRPHLTMLIPMNFAETDSINAIKLRNMFYTLSLNHFATYIQHYDNIGVTNKKPVITVSKLLHGNQMEYHNDSNDPKHIIGMLYINNDYVGGEIQFRDLGISYKPNPGDFIIYPGSISHSVTMMNGSPRYSIGFGLIDPAYIGKEVTQV